MNIGRKLYYEKNNGVIVWDKGEMWGDVRPTTFEEDCKTKPILDALGDALGVMELPFGDFRTEFENCNGFKVNPTNKIIDFMGVEISSTPITEIFVENITVPLGVTVHIPAEYKNLSGIDTSINKTVEVLINGIKVGDLNIVNGVGNIEFKADEVGVFSIQIENKICEVTVHA